MLITSPKRIGIPGQAPTGPAPYGATVLFSFEGANPEAYDQLRARGYRPGEDFRPPRLEVNLEMAGRLEPVAECHGVPVAAVAVAWVLATPGVTGAIVGARRPSRVDGWLPAGNLRLSEADLAELA